MSVTVTSEIAPRNFGFYTVNLVTLDSSYLSEGEPLTAEQLGLSSVDFAICNIVAGDEAKSSEIFVSEAYYTPTTEKIHVLNSKTGVEVASTKNMEKVQVRVIAFGKSRAK